jgi:hypothetical protein
MRNVKTVRIFIPNTNILYRIINTPTFNRLFRTTPIVGENLEFVNHQQFADMNRLFPIIGISFEEVKYIQ